MKNTEKIEYETPETEQIELETPDVITASDGFFDGEEDEF